MKSINWKYAMGEILIVIIGITIAFSMNTCAEQTKEKKQRLQYLTNLRNDVEADKSQLKKVTQELEEKLESCNRIIPKLNTDDKEKMTVVQDIFKVAEISNFSSKDITYRTLINSGDLKLIEEFELKKAIESHYSSYDIMRQDYIRQENIHKEYLGPYFVHEVDYDAFRNGVFGFKNEQLLKNIVQSMRGSFQIKLNATEKGIQSCDSLLVLLDEYLAD
ncbi:MAG: hypothetical protein HKO54_04285 [Flavobacteriaceae bacterium]|nr:hypothetical protein [Flavobacteriaceae bacterium]